MRKSFAAGFRRAKASITSIMLAWKIAKYFGMTIEEVFIFEEEAQ